MCGSLKTRGNAMKVASMLAAALAAGMLVAMPVTEAQAGVKVAACLTGTKKVVGRLHSPLRNGGVLVIAKRPWYQFFANGRTAYPKGAVSAC